VKIRCFGGDLTCCTCFRASCLLYYLCLVWSPRVFILIFFISSVLRPAREMPPPSSLPLYSHELHSVVWVSVFNKVWWGWRSWGIPYLLFQRCFILHTLFPHFACQGLPFRSRATGPDRGIYLRSNPLPWSNCVSRATH